MDENGSIDLSALQDMIKTAVTEELTNAVNSGVLVELDFQAVVEVSDREYLQMSDLITCDTTGKMSWNWQILILKYS